MPTSIKRRPNKFLLTFGTLLFVNTNNNDIRIDNKWVLIFLLYFLQ